MITTVCARKCFDQNVRREGPDGRRHEAHPARAGEDELMAAKQIRNHGKKVWMARVAYRGRRRASFCDSKEAARQAEADPLKQLKVEAGQAETEGQRPATLRQLFEAYAADLEARGKGTDTIGRATETEGRRAAHAGAA